MSWRGRWQHALFLFDAMGHAMVEPNAVTFVSVISVVWRKDSGKIAGKRVHGVVIRMIFSV